MRKLHVGRPRLPGGDARPLLPGRARAVHARGAPERPGRARGAGAADAREPRVRPGALLVGDHQGPRAGVGVHPVPLGALHHGRQVARRARASGRCSSATSCRSPRARASCPRTPASTRARSRPCPRPSGGCSCPRTALAALNRFRATRSIQDASSTAREVCAAESDRLDSELAMIRYIAWAIPSIGFIGTVRGIGDALTQAHRAVQGDISGVTEALGVAFNSTFIALLLSLVLMFVLHQLQLKQERQVLDTESYVDERLLANLQAWAGDGARPRPRRQRRRPPGLAEAGAVLGPSPGCALVESRGRSSARRRCAAAGSAPARGERLLARLDTAPLGPPFPEGLAPPTSSTATSGPVGERRARDRRGAARGAAASTTSGSWACCSASAREADARRGPRGRGGGGGLGGPAPASACCTSSWRCTAPWSRRSARRRAAARGARDRWGRTAGTTLQRRGRGATSSCARRASTRCTTRRPSRRSSTGCRPGSRRSSGTERARWLLPAAGARLRSS